MHFRFFSVLTGCSFKCRESTRVPQMPNGHMITSYSGCNNEGGRQVYKVLSISTTVMSTVQLDVMPVGWNGTFSNINMEFGHTSNACELRSHLKVRGDPLSRQTASTSSATFNFTRRPTLTVLSSPSGTPSGQMQQFDLSHSVKDY